MKILITAPSLNPNKNVSGISTVVSTVIEYNHSNKYFHYLLGRPDAKQSFLNLLFQLVKQVLLFPFVVKKQEIQIVHQNLPLNPKGLIREFVINLWCKLLNVPVLLHVHGGKFLINGTKNILFQYLAKKIFENSKKVIVLSELEKSALKDNFNFTESDVLMNSVDVSKYSNQSISKNQIPTILFMGRIHESKGVEDIVEAFRLLIQRVQFKFILCGDGPLCNYMITKCETILGNNFEYRGVVSGELKLNAIQESDFFILPSRYGEGLPMALLETMAAGLIPIVTDDSSMKFVVQHMTNGIRVNKYDSQSIVDEMLHVLKNEKLINALSISARKTIIDKYDIQMYLKKLNEFYNFTL